MKRSTLACSIIILLATVFSSCKPTVTTIPEYAVTVTPVKADNAPALQSFAHGVNGADWLLFAGRTNRINDDGGLHKINGNSNYSTTSFLPLSYNEDIFVYNAEKDEVSGLSFNEMVSEISSFTPAKGSIDSTAILIFLPQIVTALNANGTVFRATNPLVMQEENYMYLVGGYGTPLDHTDDGNAYQTFDQVAKINVPSMINVIKGDLNSLSLTDWQTLVAFGNSRKIEPIIINGKTEQVITEGKLVSTGGELFKIGDTFYLAGGHNFGSSTPNGQQYVDAVYPFTLSTSSKPLELTVTVGTPITDIAKDELGTLTADTTSNFRRRDGPIVPALYMDGNNLTEGLAFYGGVFQPKSKGIAPNENPDSLYNRAWNSAIYVHPAFSSLNPSPESPYYTFDSGYDQGNLNVYACADIEFYDASTATVHTLLIGGIGDGQAQPQTTMLSGFTNSLMHVRYDLQSGKSTPKLDSENIFNTDNFYGAESAFIYNTKANVVFTKANSKTTEVIDANATFKSGQSVDVGYIYGGIEAFNATPSTYGPGNSAASNKVWKVTVTKNTVNQ